MGEDIWRECGKFEHSFLCIELNLSVGAACLGFNWDVFIQVYESLSHFREESEISTWIYRIAVNKSLDFIRNPMTFA